MRFIKKNGKVAKSIDEASTLVSKRVAFCTTLVNMMDGTRGRRMAAFWRYAKDSDNKTYTVYSYGDHWPLYVWDEQAQAWYGNKTKHGRTTSKHSNQVQPSNVQAWVELDTLALISERGVAGWVRDKMEQA